MEILCGTAVNSMLKLSVSTKPQLRIGNIKVAGAGKRHSGSGYFNM